METESFFKFAIDQNCFDYVSGGVSDNTLLDFGKQHWADTQLALLRKEYNFVYIKRSAFDAMKKQTIVIGPDLTESRIGEFLLCSIVPDAVLLMDYEPHERVDNRKVACLFKDAELAVEFQLRYT